MTHHTIETDLLVAGGGMAGVCAAIAAARHGAKVVLVQDRSVLGGNASSEVRMHIVGADCHGSRKGTRESGILEELRIEDAVRNPDRCHPLWDLILYEKVLAEPNITLLLDTAVVSVQMTSDPAARRNPDPPRSGRMYEYAGQTGRIRSVTALRNITEEQFTIVAKFFADCTGDGRMAYEAGADFRIGRESRAMHGESLAPEQDDVHTMGSSILITSRKTDHAVPFVPPAFARKFSPEMLKVGRSIGSWEYGFWWVEWGGHIDTLKDHSTIIRHELYKIALGLWDYIKNSGRFPDSKNWALDWIGPIPGKRESRRFLGPHILTQQDVQQSRVFEDEVAYGGWPIDLHPPLGIDDIENPPYISVGVPQPYGIPLRCYFSRNIENLFLAGRDISTTHVAFGSTRVMGTCAAGGEAVGTAAAYCVRHNLATPAALVADRGHVFEVKQALLRADATLLNTVADPSRNKAHSAKVTASSVADGSSPENVTDGHTRDLLDAKTGLLVKSRGWRSLPLGGKAAWIEFEWKGPVEVTEIHLFFDSGFSRQLTLSQSDSTTRTTIRAAQPETVKKYTVSTDGVEIVNEPNNYQRKRVHVLSASRRTTRLRIDMLQTNGSAEARLLECRVY